MDTLGGGEADELGRAAKSEPLRGHLSLFLVGDHRPHSSAKEAVLRSTNIQHGKGEAVFHGYFLSIHSIIHYQYEVVPL